MIEHRRRKTDRSWYSSWLPERAYRDLWLLLITGLVLLALWVERDTNNRVETNQRADTQALCSFRQDLQRRVTTGEQFLQTHPQGIPGVPVATIRLSLQGQRSTLRALRPLVCPES